jgi:hypothetical protein
VCGWGWVVVVFVPIHLASTSNSYNSIDFYTNKIFIKTKL